MTADLRDDTLSADRYEVSIEDAWLLTVADWSALPTFDEPRCDLCNRLEADSPLATKGDTEGDWNGDTGCHLSCEAAA